MWDPCAAADEGSEGEASEAPEAGGLEEQAPGGEPAGQGAQDPRLRIEEALKISATPKGLKVTLTHVPGTPLPTIPNLGKHTLSCLSKDFFHENIGKEWLKFERELHERYLYGAEGLEIVKQKAEAYLVKHDIRLSSWEKQEVMRSLIEDYHRKDLDNAKSHINYANYRAFIKMLDLMQIRPPCEPRGRTNLDTKAKIGSKGGRNAILTMTVFILDHLMGFLAKKGLMTNEVSNS
jgi:hypothetical protein